MAAEQASCVLGACIVARGLLALNGTVDWPILPLVTYPTATTRRFISPVESRRILA